MNSFSPLNKSSYNVWILAPWCERSIFLASPSTRRRPATHLVCPDALRRKWRNNPDWISSVAPPTVQCSQKGSPTINPYLWLGQHPFDNVVGRESGEQWRVFKQWWNDCVTKPDLVWRSKYTSLFGLNNLALKLDTARSSAWKCLFAFGNGKIVS